MSETIVALASGAGRAGVAVVRMSGPAALPCLEQLCGGAVPAPRRLSLRRLTDPKTGADIDEALVVYFPAPRTYTGEDVVELHLHGGRAIVDAALDAVSRMGPCRLAEPGEFTRRAFENGALDLTRAEAVADLIDAETEAQRRQALRQFDGAMQTVFDGWRDQLILALAALEAAIDFPDEADIPTGVDAPAHGILTGLRGELKAALADAHRGRAVRDGYRIAIIGAPNAGKSSLLNRLAKHDAAIVSAIPGTTRDVVEVRLNLAGYPIVVADTAGLRETEDPVEQEGVRRAQVRAADADLRILVMDPRDPPPNPEILRKGDVALFNKSDLGDKPPPLDLPAGVERLEASALTGAGLDRLEQVLADQAVAALSSAAPALATRVRHIQLLADADAHIDRALSAHARGAGPELVSEDVRLAARALGRVTGTVDVEDLLDRIFSEFCVGK